MNEVVRQRVIEKINKGISDRDSLGSKYELLEEMKKNPEVIKYLEMVAEIKRINDELDFYKRLYSVKGDTLENRIDWEFSLARESCSHNIWVYGGSYYKYINHKNETDFYRDFGENCGSSIHPFSYNQYTCLECNKKMIVEDYEKFEREHIVLKNPNRKKYIDIDYYRGIYYQMLYYNYDLKEAEDLIVKEFNEVELEGKKSTFVLKKTK